MVRYAPAASRSKVVILDEAHMLTGEASNALLKTLEEPPDRVIFVMATTEPENLVDTIRSRSQHFHFRALTFAEISGRLPGNCRQGKSEHGTGRAGSDRAHGRRQPARRSFTAGTGTRVCGDTIPTKKFANCSAWSLRMRSRNWSERLLQVRPIEPWAWCTRFKKKAQLTALLPGSHPPHAKSPNCAGVRRGFRIDRGNARPATRAGARGSTIQRRRLDALFFRSCCRPTMTCGANQIPECISKWACCA